MDHYFGLLIFYKLHECQHSVVKQHRRSLNLASLNTIGCILKNKIHLQSVIRKSMVENYDKSNTYITQSKVNYNFLMVIIIFYLFNYMVFTLEEPIPRFLLKPVRTSKTTS